MKINAAWHAKHLLPARASLSVRVRWHVAHANACGCRKMPRDVVSALSDQEQPAPKKRRRAKSLPVGKH